MQIIENEDFYFNEEGLMVLTAKYLSKSRKCCGNGCLHCPYKYENVAEPLKSRLLSQRADLNRKRDKKLNDKI